MKPRNDLISAIVTAIIGVLIAFFVTNFFLGPMEDFSYKNIESNINSNLVEPDPEIFNYKSLNPTVEVYVGECTEYDQYGNCIETVTGVDDKPENVDNEIDNKSSNQSKKDTSSQENP